MQRSGLKQKRSQHEEDEEEEQGKVKPSSKSKRCKATLLRSLCRGKERVANAFEIRCLLNEESDVRSVVCGFVSQTWKRDAKDDCQSTNDEVASEPILKSDDDDEKPIDLTDDRDDVKMRRWEQTHKEPIEETVAGKATDAN